MRPHLIEALVHLMRAQIAALEAGHVKAGLALFVVVRICEGVLRTNAPPVVPS